MKISRRYILSNLLYNPLYKIIWYRYYFSGFNKLKENCYYKFNLNQQKMKENISKAILSKINTLNLTKIDIENYFKWKNLKKESINILNNNLFHLIDSYFIEYKKSKIKRDLIEIESAFDEICKNRNNSLKKEIKTQTILIKTDYIDIVFEALNIVDYLFINHSVFKYGDHQRMFETFFNWLLKEKFADNKKNEKERIEFYLSTAIEYTIRNLKDLPEQSKIDLIPILKEKAESQTDSEFFVQLKNIDSEGLFNFYNNFYEHFEKLNKDEFESLLNNDYTGRNRLDKINKIQKFFDTNNFHKLIENDKDRLKSLIGQKDIKKTLPMPISENNLFLVLAYLKTLSNNGIVRHNFFSLLEKNKVFKMITDDNPYSSSTLRQHLYRNLVNDKYTIDNTINDFFKKQDLKITSNLNPIKLNPKIG